MNEELERRLNAEFAAYLSEMRCLPADEVVARAREIVCVESVYGFLKSRQLPENQLRYLEQLRYPLSTAGDYYADCEFDDFERIRDLLYDAAEHDVFHDAEKLYVTEGRFFRKPINIETLKEDSSLLKLHPFVVEKVVELTPRQFEYFSNHLFSDDASFLQRNIDLMRFEDGCYHCLLVTTQDRGEGILVDAEGFDYARYASYVPDCKRLDVKKAPVERYEDTPHVKSSKSKSHER